MLADENISQNAKNIHVFIQIENKTSIFQVIEEPEDLAEDLCEARCSDLEQRRADR